MKHRTIQNILLTSALLFAAGLVFLSAAAHAAPKCVDYFTAAGKEAAKNGKDLKPVSLILGRAGGCCAADLAPTAAQQIAANIRAIVNVAAATAHRRQSDKEEAGKIMSAALGCAGQPGIVAVDPALYSSVLADSAEFAELARDERVGQDVQFARQHGNRPGNNQQPTVSIEQK